MSDANSLHIKYGLRHLPTDYEVSRWVAERERLIAIGISPEASEDHAATQVFQDACSIDLL